MNSNAKKLKDYMEAVESLIQMIINDEDYMSIYLDERFIQLRQAHRAMGPSKPGPIRSQAKRAPTNRKPAKRKPTKAMRKVQTEYDKEARRFALLKNPP